LRSFCVLRIYTSFCTNTHTLITFLRRAKRVFFISCDTYHMLNVCAVNTHTHVRECIWHSFTIWQLSYWLNFKQLCHCVYLCDIEFSVCISFNNHIHTHNINILTHKLYFAICEKSGHFGQIITIEFAFAYALVAFMNIMSRTHTQLHFTFEAT
jgi:hypothetical protein